MPDPHTEKGSGHNYKQNFHHAVCRAFNICCNGLLQGITAITESDRKRQKVERRMLLTSDGGPYLVSEMPGRWFNF